ncbi:MAG: hybrid sensor histidine kinase/response regulator [Chloroflexi bacterium]|nr:hybrid sensor histidine kinase/response regulator [Chloroflexota bacterium]
MTLLQINALLVEDDPGDAHMVKDMLHQALRSTNAPMAIHLTHKQRIRTAQQFLKTNLCDLILLDLSLPDSSGLDTFHKVKNSHPTIPVIILSGYANHEFAIQAVQQGAQDYLDKNDLTSKLLLKSIHYGLERHRLLLEIGNRAAELESQNKALNDFAHTVAHQIQGLLSQMVGYASLVDAHYQDQLNESAKMAVDQVMQSGYKMNNVITELLFLASMRSENIQVGKLNNKRIIIEVVKRLRYQIRGSKAKISIPDKWPDALGYAPWIEEVWLNYISNGLKYGGDELNPPHLQLGAQNEENGMVRFWVKDNGPGISVMDQKRLFKAHTRATSKKVRGEGVGLSIVWSIVKKCGGNVGVDSEEGAGSCFWFTLPEAT